MRVHRLTFPVAAALMGGLVLTACDGGDAADDAGGDTAPAEGNVVEVLGTHSLDFEPTSLTAEAGEVTVELTTEDGVNHDFVIEDLDDLLVAEADAGETATGTVDLEPGEYTFYCSVPGHRPAGMEGVLTVE